jgi:hypothetical protein
METYTWEVLPPELKSRSVVEQLVAEYNWTLPRLAERGLARKHMRMKNDVSDSDSVSLFSAAAELPNWRHAHWKTDFFATHRMDSPRAISPLCQAL